VRVGREEAGKIISGGTERVLFRRPFVLYELIIVKPVVARLKKPSGVKRSKEIGGGAPLYRRKS